MQSKDLTNGASPLVTLGMPVYNGERYIAQAIDSVLKQSFADFELVISDNASTDKTEAICREFAAKDKRVKYHRNPENIGAHPNFNRTFELSSGKYFKWAPHDDVLHPDYLAVCVEAMEAAPDAVVCQTQFMYIDEEGKGQGVSGTDLPEAQDPSVGTRFSAAILNAHNCYEVMGLYRRTALANSILLKSFHGADRALVAQVTLSGRFLHVEKPYLLVRDHKERYTRAQVKPKDRAVWHDTKLKGKRTFPAWRVYGEYWAMVMTSKLSAWQKIRIVPALLGWWFVNWNAARMAVDVISNVVPGVVGWAESIKQRFFSPAPGIDTLRKTQGDR
jgi:glycosyltransferase involved in cell wall biosynthesis